ncbi:putative NBD/HSP70 family sugar kinase [Microbacterium sp. AG790]|uniref:ROK family protein n=1 Tax=Microbacterium sp. AG790 TaxID=2183995 RepID=UPI000EAF32E8|nr:ROK family protein [Microbacterium sp. AG790]RKS86772.1 putative NBD/HSP70 family sugar kinase [Microbacterium sp. AG790]
MSQTVLDTGTGRASVDGVLDFAWDAGTFTATEAMRAASLTRSTAIEAIDTLIAAGVLQELPNARDAGEYRAGRPARRFRLRDDAGVVAALDAGDTHLTAAVSDLSGEVLLRRQIALSPAQSVDERRDTIVAHLRATLAEAGVARDDVLSLCVGVAAPVTLQGQSPPHPEGFWERTNPGLIDALGDEADVVEVKNDAQLAAAAEGTGGEAVGCRDYVALLAGERLGAGVVVDGHLLHGSHGGVGEMFAFDFIRDVDSAFGLGPTLERLAREAIAKAETETTERSGLAAMDPAQVHGRDVLELAAGGDPLAIEITDAIGRVLARIVGVLGNMFDPERVIVCGAIADGIQPVLDAAQRTLAAQIHLPAPTLLRSRLGGDVVIRGALARARDSARSTALPRRVARATRAD